MHRIMLVLAAFSLQTIVVADEPVTRYRLVTPRDDGVIATGLNSQGDLVGFECARKRTTPTLFPRCRSA